MSSNNTTRSFVPGSQLLTIGLATAGIGLGIAGLCAAQTLIPLWEGRETAVSSVVAATELVAAGVLAVTGFWLMVLGSSPFETDESDVQFGAFEDDAAFGEEGGWSKSMG